MHKHLVQSIIKALQDIFQDDRYADKIIEKNLKSNKKWGARDRRFFAESVYEIIRWWRLYWYLLDEEPDLRFEKLFLIFGIHNIVINHDLPKWLEFEALDVEMVKRRLKHIAKTPIEVQTSMPLWICKLIEKEFGADNAEKILHALNKKAPVDLRCNTLRSNIPDLQLLLQGDEIETEPIPDTPQGLALKIRKNVFISQAFKKGAFEVQDRASQKVAPFLRVEPGHRVVDACAGAGGKSLHLAALMKNKGKIIALDVIEWKLNELKKRAARDGVDIIEARLIDSQKVIKRLEASADRLLLDVPCSGLGVIRRNPDTKWKISINELDRLNGLQKDILLNYCDIAKPGGLMVYSTCSFLKSENENQIQWFLDQKKGQWELVDTLRINPGEEHGDGFFAALMVKK